jgi:hypothetical protein
VRVLLAFRAPPLMVAGIERFAESMAEWLCGAGHDVTVATRTPSGSGEPAWPSRVMRRPSLPAFIEAARRSDVVNVNGLPLRTLGPPVAVRRPPVINHEGNQAVCPKRLRKPRRGMCNAGATPPPCGGCRERGTRGALDVRMPATVCRVVSANVAVGRGVRGSRAHSFVRQWMAADRAGGDHEVIYKGVVS